ncbi:MAG: efflux RND transporter permease subunit [Candidatus Zhuqueibacterota bacterium]
MRKLTEFSVNYPVTILMLVLAVLLLGFISFEKLGIDLFPDLNNPRIFVELKAGERPPDEIESQFVERIESLAIRQKKVIQVSSIIRVGTAQITVEYGWDADMDEAFLDLQKTLTSFGQNAEIDEMIISQHDPNASPVMLLGLSNEQITDMDELRRVAENYLRNELIRLEGIAEVELLGQEEKEVVIETNNYLMEAYGLTPATIANRIRNYNRNSSGGSIVEMGLKYVIKGVGEFQSLDDIGNVIVAYKTHQSATATGTAVDQVSQRVPVYLKDVATLSLKNKDPENIVRINSTRCMGLAIYKETKFNTVKAVDDLLNALEELRKALPGYSITVIQNQGEFIKQAVDEVKQTALIGALLAVVVLFIFLRRIGVTTIISVAIPISVIATFNLMFFKGLTINVMTLGGLALGAGMLVDNAIVVMENIFQKLESGHSLREASVLGTSQVATAITSSTITTIVVFLPIVYLHGSAGELFKDQAWTVAFSLLSSLVVAILVIPMLSSRFLKGFAAREEQKIASLRFLWYRSFLSRVLDRRWTVISVAVVLIVAAVLLIPIIGSEFVPRTDLNEFSIEMTLPEGTELARTEQTVDNIENIVRSILGDEIHTIYSQIGPTTDLTVDANAVFEDENTATTKIILKPDHKISSQQVIAQIGRALEDIPDLETQFIQEQSALQTTLGTEVAPILVEIKGDEMEVIQQLTEQVKQKMLEMADLFNVESSFDEGRPEIDIKLDRVQAGIYNLNIESITSELEAQLAGTTAGQWENEGELQDITIKVPDISVGQIDDIVINSGEQKIRLDEIATIQLTSAPKEIKRKNQVRIGTISAHLKTKKPFDHVVSQIKKQLQQIDFPADYKFEITGEEQKRQESFSNLKFALILSIILVYMVLASQFESLLHPFTIILTIPLAIVGTIFLFFFTGQTFNMMAYTGIIMLGGIAVNNSILLVDAITQLRQEGFALRDSIVEAGQRRIRPILMTSLTTILAMLPLTFGFGEGAALRSPMAIAVVGGLVTSTLMSLIFIPCVYYVVELWRGTK